MASVDFSDLLAPQEGQPLTFSVGKKKPATVDISDLLAAPPERTGMEQAKHYGSLAGRVAMQGGLTGIAGLPALANDAVQQAANWGYQAADWGAEQFGYSPGLAAAHRRSWGGPMGTTRKVTDRASQAADTLGLDQPETGGERVAAAIGEGAVSAATGVGLGSLMARAPGMAGRVGTVLAENPVSQVLSGATGGGAAQEMSEQGGNGAASTAAGVVGSLVPAILARSGRTDITTATGKNQLAGRIARDIVRKGDDSVDPRQVAQTLETSRTVTPGLRQFSSDAARNPGLGSVSKTLRGWSEGADVTLLNDNSSLLSRALDRFGARGGTAQASRDRINAQDALDLERIVPRGGPSGTVDDLMDNAERGMNYRARETNAAVGEAHGELLGRASGYARPIVRPDGNGGFDVVDRRMTVRNMHNLRTDISQARKPTGTNPQGMPSQMRHARGETRGFMDDLTGRIDETRGDTEYTDWLGRSRSGRMEADRQEYMENFANSTSKKGEFLDDGSRIIDQGAWLRTMGEGRNAKPLPGGNRAVSFRQLDPARQGFLRGVRTDFNQSRYASRQPQVPKERFSAEVEDAVLAARTPTQKAKDAALEAVGWGANAGAKLFGPVAGFAGRALSNVGERALRSRTGEVAGDIRSILGRAETDPEQFARLLREREMYTPGAAGTLGLMGRQLGRGAAHGFIAGERTKRYR